MESVMLICLNRSFIERMCGLWKCEWYRLALVANMGVTGTYRPVDPLTVGVICLCLRRVQHECADGYLPL